MESREYKLLVKELQRIARIFLPPVKPKGNYSTRDLLHMRAYLLLVHAEIENYLENRCLRAAQQAIRQYPNRKSSALLLAVYHPGAASMTADSRVHNALRCYEGIVEKNNGIGREDLLKLLRPLGVEESDLDPLWLQLIEDFKRKRGEIAHRSRLAMQTNLDPVTICRDINAILVGVGGGLKSVDRLLPR